ncbi:hypothetical protein Bca101_017042 [Brassica carinata]
MAPQLRQVVLIMKSFVRTAYLEHALLLHEFEKMAQFMKLLVTIALTFAITIAIITTTTINTNTKTETFALKDPSKDLTPPREIKIRPSRFLAQKSDEGQGPRARKRNTDCNKEPKICSRTGAANATMACCNNKCIDLLTDTKNCGACQKKCWFGQTCCGGECADMDFSKRHCGKCNNRCKPGVFCVLGMCNYA